MDNPFYLALFIVLIALFVAVVLIILFYRPMKHKKYSKNFREIYGKKVYLAARDNDFFLINEFEYGFSDGTRFYIDHILFGEKFIYIITDMYVNGSLEGTEKDPSWLRRTKDGKKQVKAAWIDNPLTVNSKLIGYFSSATRLDPSYFVSIVLVNNDCELTNYQQTSKINYLSTPKKVNKLIEDLEKTDIKKLNQAQLQFAVQGISKLNIHRKEK